MSRIVQVVSAALLLTLITGVAIPPRPASAHETRAVAAGKYEMVVGFIVEPALEGQKNGLDLRVRVPGTPATPVLGVEKTLQWEITHVATNKTATFPIRTIFNDPGHYTADLILTAPGQYRFRFSGTIEGVAINETFTSGERFSNVEPSEELQFPEQISEAQAIEGAALDAQAVADEAADTASTARMLGLVAIALSVMMGGTAIALALRRR
jgi:hypothetical protein